MDVAARSILAALCVNLPTVALDLKSLCEGILILQFVQRLLLPLLTGDLGARWWEGQEGSRARRLTLHGPASPALSSPLTESSCSDFVTLHPLRSPCFPLTLIVTGVCWHQGWLLPTPDWRSPVTVQLHLLLKDGLAVKLLG